jgi:transposase
MANLSDFHRGQMVGARMTGACVTETSRTLDVPSGTVTKEMTTFERKGKTSTTKQRFGSKSKLSERNRRYLNRIVRDNRKTTAVKITADLSGHLPVEFK